MLSVLQIARSLRTEGPFAGRTALFLSLWDRPMFPKKSLDEIVDDLYFAGGATMPKLVVIELTELFPVEDEIVELILKILREPAFASDSIFEIVSKQPGEELIPTYFPTSMNLFSTVDTDVEGLKANPPRQKRTSKTNFIVTINSVDNDLPELFRIAKQFGIDRGNLWVKPGERLSTSEKQQLLSRAVIRGWNYVTPWKL